MIPMTRNTASAVGAAGSGAVAALSAKGIRDRADTMPHLPIAGAGSRQARILRPGEALFLEGDAVASIFILRTGWAFRHQCLEDGRRQIVDFVLPGDILGTESSRFAPYGVEALSTCSWSVMPRARFFSDLQHQPALGMKIVDLLSQAQLRAFEQMTSIGRRTARERVAQLLLDLARRVRSSAVQCEGVEIAMPLMLSHIGDALGLATETVCRCLGELKRAGFLVFSGGRLEILDLDGLSQLAGTQIQDEDEAGGLRA